MANVPATVSYIELDGDYAPIESVELTCSKCDHSEEAYGTSENSILRCAAQMRENCPRGERNFYIPDE